ncbi:hypothetical protein ACFL6B_06080 [Thermodesulfobacteriota bacterium]
MEKKVLDEDTVQDEAVIENIDEGKRTFLKKVLIGTVFAAPVVQSYSMNKFKLGPPDAAASIYNL